MPGTSVGGAGTGTPTRVFTASTLKCNNSLANNLCPDHRDKQAGKPCLACEIERLQSENKELRVWYHDSETELSKAKAEVERLREKYERSA